MTLSQEITALARDLAESNGRDWSDCGVYERESYRDEARRQMCNWVAPSTGAEQ
jgi:hypothetical protein